MIEVQVRLAKSDDLTDKLTDQLLRERLAAFLSNATRIDNRIATECAEYAEEAQGYYDCVAQLYELRLSLWPNGPGVYHLAIRDMCQRRNAHWNNALACRQTYQALEGSAVREKEKMRRAEEELVRFEVSDVLGFGLMGADRL